MASSPSPTCLVNGAAPPGIVSAGATVTIALATPAGAQIWLLQAVGTDELNTAAAINATLVINQTTKTATFTAPAGAGSAVIFMSTVGVGNGTQLGQGQDLNGVVQKAYTTTFKVDVQTGASLSVLAQNEELEESAIFGWIKVINAAIRATGATSAALGIYGDGSDGTATCDGSTAVAGMTLSGGNYTLNRDVYFTSLTVNSGVSVNANSFKVFALTLNNNGHVHADAPVVVYASGVAAPGGGQGVISGNSGTLGGGGTGNYAGSSGSAVVNALGGAGGSGMGSAGNGVTRPAANAGSPHDLQSALRGFGLGLSTGTTPVLTVFNGGAGGSGATNGGGDSASGGGGGGVLMVAAETLTGSGSISANGAAGISLHVTYGTGGGGGGLVILVTRNKAGFSGTVQANGGAAPASPPNSGSTAGAAGQVIQFTA